MFKISKLKIRYSKKLIINDLSLEIKKKKLTTIIGINGAGKTTLIKAMMKLLKVSEGTIELQDKNIQKYKSKDYAKKVAYVPQHISFPEGMSVFDFVSFGRNPHTNSMGILTMEDRKKVNDALKICELTKFKDIQVDSLSGGQRQMCAIALTVAQDSEIILLDEPNSYLDIHNVDEIMHILRDLVDVHNKTIVMTTHDINQASKFSDSIIMMRDGKIQVNNIPKKVITRKNLKECYNVEAKLVSVNGKPIIVDYRKVKNEI